MLKRLIESPRLDVFIAIVIALVPVTTAFAAWRASMVSSAAGDAIRQGLIDAVKKQAAQAGAWPKAAMGTPALKVRLRHLFIRMFTLYTFIHRHQTL